jgi:hypothetical protein
MLSFSNSITSSHFALAAASITTRPRTGSIHTRVSRQTAKARGSSSLVTLSLMSRISLRPGL